VGQKETQVRLGVATAKIGARVLDLRSATASYPVAELEQRGVELRSTARTGNCHENTDYARPPVYSGSRFRSVFSSGPTLRRL
jgi:hypothetical protein